MMNLKITCILLLQILFTSVFAQKKEIQSITEHELKAHLEFIASDLMQGRDFGTKIPGLEITADYIKNQCIEMGLNPGLKNYEQSFRMISVKTKKEGTLIKLRNKTGEEIFRSTEIYAFPGMDKNDTINAKVVFAGYGFTDEKTGYNDLDGLDLKDKIVMFMTRNKDIASQNTDIKESSNLEMAKIARIIMSGAKAIIFVSDPLNPDKSWFEMVKEYTSEGTNFLEGGEPMDIPGNLILSENELADEILKETGKTLKEFQEEINKTGKPNSFELENITAEIQISKNTETVTGKNIIAVIKGSDPVLKNEYVVLTAHYDHVGVTRNGEINNGADDNGSGTVSLLEVAEAFSQMKKKPARSIVFAWVSAEEKGLIGSEYYCKNPAFPLEKTIANINLDMVGRSAEKETGPITDSEKSLAGPNGIYIISGNEDSEISKIGNKISAGLKLVPSDALTEEFMTGSDHYNFHKKGIPFLCITTGLHEDYHQPTDDSDKIDYTKMKRVADLTFLITLEIANRKKPLNEIQSGK
jgi:hypothetical protein